MSKSTFLTAKDEKGCFLIRDEFHRALQQEGLIEEVSLDACIDIDEASEGATLKRISIIELRCQDDKSTIDRIWKINLEKDIPGISTKSKTTEIALLVLQRFDECSYRLSIILIELKSSLQDKKTKAGSLNSSTLTEIEDKFRCTMNRMYLLLTLNNYKSPKQRYEDASINIKFKGIIFYNKNNLKIDNDIDNDSELYAILIGSKKNNLISCETILRKQDKIEIKFFSKQGSDRDDRREVKLKELL